MKNNIKNMLDHLPEQLSILCEKDIVLFPGTTLPLKISNPMYLNMIDGCFKNERLLGLVQRIPTKNESAQIGCLSRICGFSETTHGGYFILLLGICRFRITGKPLYKDSTPQPVAVEYNNFLEDLSTPTIGDETRAKPLIDLFEQYALTIGFHETIEKINDLSFDMLVRQLSMSCPFTPTEKQALLESPNHIQQYETLKMLMEVKIAEDMKSIQ